MRPSGDGTDRRPRAESLADPLLAWFRSHRRPLPWRRSRDPYRVWISEVLLQQTRVETASAYFDRFVTRFPNVRTLGAARLADVLKLWQGAGYYARARHLHAAARELLRSNAGKLPRTVPELESLPGIGPYTARAIAAIAYGEPVVALDANGARVASRWFLERGDVRSATVRSRLRAGLERLLPLSPAGELNEALMELGETICTPVRPRCDRCPVAFGCRARRELDDPSIIPRRAPKPPRKGVRAAVVVLTDGARWLVQRRPPTGLLGGLWEFPGGRIEPGETPREAARRELEEETGATAGRLSPVGVVHHDYTHLSVELHVFRGRVQRPPRLGRDRRWVTPSEIENLPLPRATEKIVHRLTFAPVGSLAGPEDPSRPGRSGASAGSSP